MQPAPYFRLVLLLHLKAYTSSRFESRPLFLKMKAESKKYCRYCHRTDVEFVIHEVYRQ